MKSLMKKVSYFQHADRREKLLSLQSESCFTVVTVRMKDGRALSEYQGSEDRRKLTGQGVLAKYRRNVEMVGFRRSISNARLS